MGCTQARPMPPTTPLRGIGGPTGGGGGDGDISAPDDATQELLDQLSSPASMSQMSIPQMMTADEEGSKAASWLKDEEHEGEEEEAEEAGDAVAPLKGAAPESVLKPSQQLPPPLDPQRKLEDFYDVQGKIGFGHYAQVFVGVNKLTKERVAIKMIDKRVSREDRLDLEVSVMRQAGSHPHIVRLMDVFVTPTHLNLVLELVEGGELFQYLVDHGPYSEADAARHIRNVTSAIAWLHSKKIVHRDLKPENLLLTSNNEKGVVKVADFGLAKLMATDLTRTVCGTWAYCAPEVKRPQTGHDSKCDIWSIGVVTYVLLAAFHPFDPEGTLSDNQIWERISHCRWNFDDPAWHGVSREARDFVTCCLQMDPAKRPTALALLNHPWVKPRFAENPLSPMIDQKLAQFQDHTKNTRSNPFLKAVPAFLGGRGGGATSSPTAATTVTGKKDSVTSNGTDSPQEPPKKKSSSVSNSSPRSASTSNPGAKPSVRENDVTATKVHYVDFSSSTPVESSTVDDEIIATSPLVAVDINGDASVPPPPSSSNLPRNVSIAVTDNLSEATLSLSGESDNEQQQQQQQQQGEGTTAVQ